MGFQISIILGAGFYAGCYFIDREYINPSNGLPYTSGDIIAIILILIMATRNLAHVG